MKILSINHFSVAFAGLTHNFFDPNDVKFIRLLIHFTDGLYKWVCIIYECRCVLAIWTIIHQIYRWHSKAWILHRCELEPKEQGGNLFSPTSKRIDQMQVMGQKKGSTIVVNVHFSYFWCRSHFLNCRLHKKPQLMLSLCTCHETPGDHTWITS